MNSLMERRARRCLALSAALVVTGQLFVAFFVRRVGPSGIDEALRFVIGVPVALAGFALAAGLALYARWRLRPRPGARRLATVVFAAALAVPTLHAVHILWWPTRERLVRAAGAGDLAVVERCLSFGLDPNAVGMRTHGFGGRGETEPPLAAAAAGGHAAVVRTLLEAGADPAARDSAAVVAAVGAGRPEIVGVLLETATPRVGVLAQVVWEGPDPDGRRVAALSRLLDSGVPIEPEWLHLKAMFLTDNRFAAALARAESPDAPRRVALLNAIALATVRGSAEAARRYEELRGELAGPPPAGDRARALARLATLSSASARRDPLGKMHPELLLALAAKFGADGLVRTLLADGVPADPPDTRYDHPRSPLGYAAAAGNVEAARLLVAAGADVARSDSGFGTPLHGAVASGSRELVDLLIASGADPDAAQSETSPTPPSHWAAFRGDLVMLGHMLDRGASIDRRGHDERTLHSIARRRGDAEMLAFLERRAPAGDDS